MNLLPPKLSRYAAVAALLMKYGHGRATPPVAGDPPDEKPEALARDLEALGPTFVKLGQVLSTRPDLLPAAYVAALARLQDNVQSFPFTDVQRIVESELGARLSKAFASFEETPLAAASLGQVHRATLRTGRVVAVKVQRPGVAEQIATDLDALDEVAQFLDKHTGAGRSFDLTGMAAEFRESLVAELVDLGMVGRVTPDLQTRLLKLLLLVSEGRGEEAADTAVALGERRPN